MANDELCAHAGLRSFPINFAFRFILYNYFLSFTLLNGEYFLANCDRGRLFH